METLKTIENELETNETGKETTVLSERNAAVSPGPARHDGAGGGYTLEQLKTMPGEEVMKNYVAVMASLKYLGSQKKNQY